MNQARSIRKIDHEEKACRDHDKDVEVLKKMDVRVVPEKEVPAAHSTTKMSRKIRKGRCNTSTFKKAKPSSVKVILVLDVPHFEKDVVQWMTTEDKLQMMHFPNEVSRTVLKGKRKTMILIDDQTQRKYNCRLITIERASHEKYLGGQWFNLSRDRVLKVGDKLVFNLEKPPRNMHVQVLPK